MKQTTSTIIVIFGATGDLAKRKLFGALNSLSDQKKLPAKFKIIGFARDKISNRDFQKIAGTKSASYQAGLFENLDAYKDLGKSLLATDGEFKTCSNKLFYLAVAPKYYKTIFENLAQSGLTIPCSGGEGWTRVLVEKPFGEDADTAQELDELLSKLFREEQIFRIDHYLARETMQNILTFRFSNRIFEPLWNNQYIDKVELKLLEKEGVGERGAFYDDIGALRDVGQNHMLQMLALIAMGHPQRFDAAAIRRERAKILEALRPIKKSAIGVCTERGQYKEYLKLKGVKPDSSTETYFKVKVFVDNARWSGTPFYMESGKSMAENRVELNVHFKEAAPCFCPIPHTGHKHQNMISFQVKPREGITLRFWAKKPGLQNDIESKNLTLEYGGRAIPETQGEAYEKVLFDCIQGEQMLFASTEEVSAAWRFIMPILKGWERDLAPLKIY